MAVSLLSVQGDCVFAKDGTFVYLTEDGWYTAYVAFSGAFMPSKPAESLDEALGYANKIRKEMRELVGHV